MTNQEMIKLAAKAAGYSLTNGSSGYREFLCKGGVEWNPLEDDGDALRLAVKLRIDVLFSPDSVECIANTGSEVEPFGIVKYSQCQAADTRRAITRAAAEIGKARCLA